MKNKTFDFRYNANKNKTLVLIDNVKPYIRDVRIGEQVVITTEFGQRTATVVNSTDYKLNLN